MYMRLYMSGNDSLMMVAVCYRNVGKQVSHLASVLQTFEMSEIPSHSGLFRNAFCNTEMFVPVLLWKGLDEY